MQNGLLEDSYHNVAVEPLNEATNISEKEYKIRGKFATIETRNANGRIYPRSLWEREVRKYQHEIENRTINTLMEWGHPTDRLEVNPIEAVAKIEKLWIEGNFVLGEAVILDNPMGEIIKSLIKKGVQLSVSSRGSGNFNADGVVEDFNLITFDLVSKPSDQSATMYGIYESYNSARDFARKTGTPMNEILGSYHSMSAMSEYNQPKTYASPHAQHQTNNEHQEYVNRRMSEAIGRIESTLTSLITPETIKDKVERTWGIRSEDLNNDIIAELSSLKSNLEDFRREQREELAQSASKSDEYELEVKNIYDQLLDAVNSAIIAVRRVGTDIKEELNGLDIHTPIRQESKHVISTVINAVHQIVKKHNLKSDVLESIATVNDNVVEVSNAVENVNRAVVTVNRAVEGLERSITETTHAVNTTNDLLQERLDAIEVTLRAVSNAVHEIRATVNTEEEVSTLDTLNTIDTVADSVDDLKTALKVVYDDITAIKSEPEFPTSKLFDRLDRLERYNRQGLEESKAELQAHLQSQLLSAVESINESVHESVGSSLSQVIKETKDSVRREVNKQIQSQLSTITEAVLNGISEQVSVLGTNLDNKFEAMRRMNESRYSVNDYKGEIAKLYALLNETKQEVARLQDENRRLNKKNKDLTIAGIVNESKVNMTPEQAIEFDNIVNETEFNGSIRDVVEQINGIRDEILDRWEENWQEYRGNNDETESYGEFLSPHLNADTDPSTFQYDLNDDGRQVMAYLPTEIPHADYYAPNTPDFTTVLPDVAQDKSVDQLIAEGVQKRPNKSVEQILQINSTLI